MSGGGLCDGEDISTRGRIGAIPTEGDLDQPDRVTLVGEAYEQLPATWCRGHAEQAALTLDHHLVA